VHLHTVLQKETPDGRVSKIQMKLKQGVKISVVMVELNIPHDEENLILAVNGRLAEAGQILHDGDELHLIPAISGG
jgi:molybdopterin converting factor small subunit